MTAAEVGRWHRVRLHGDGRRWPEDEVVRGHTMDEALANAEHEWPRARVEYLGQDELLPSTVHDPAKQAGSGDLADNPDTSRGGWFTDMFARLDAGGVGEGAELHGHQVRLPTRDEVFGDGYDPGCPRDWWADAPLADEARVRLQLDGYDEQDDVR